MALQNALDELALDTTSAEIRDNVASATARLEAIRDRLPAGGAASEAKLEAVRTLLAGTLTVDPSGHGLATSAKQDSAQTTLTSIDGHVDGVETALATIATETKLEAVRALLAGTIAVDPSGHGLATSAKQDTAQTRLDLLATEATLASLLTELGQKIEPADLATLATAAKQDTGNTALSSIDGHVDGIEGALALLATESKLEAVRLLLAGTLAVDASGHGLATTAKQDTAQTRLDLLGTEATLAGIKAKTDNIPASPAQEHATAASPLSARLSDGGTYIGSTAQRLHVDDGGSSLSVDDNGGSLTVDNAGLDQLGAAADAEASGNGTITAILKKIRSLFGGGLPSALASDRLKVDGSGVTQPVSGTVTANAGTGTMGTDPSDRAARELGRARIWDGTDEATVIPRGSAPTASDKGLAVVSLIGKRPVYQVVTGEITSATATGVKELLTAFKASGSAKDIFILEIGVNFRVVQTAGTFAFELQFISAENATPGGTSLTAQPLNRGDAASDVTWRQVVTGAPTTAGQIFQRASFPLPAAAAPMVGSGIEGMVLFKAQTPDDSIQLRSGQADGLRVSQNIIATLTTAPIFNLYARYIERA